MMMNRIFETFANRMRISLIWLKSSVSNWTDVKQMVWKKKWCSLFDLYINDTTMVLLLWLILFSPCESTHHRRICIYSAFSPANLVSQFLSLASNLLTQPVSFHD